MAPPPDDPYAPKRHRRIRILKSLLRFAPRRARFHKYPFIGRFADTARKRAYLWSMKYPHVQPALYAGSIIALLPVPGIQLLLAFGAALMLRANIMILGGLVFITNPLTFAPIYYGTYQLGSAVIQISGFGSAPAAAESPPPTPGEMLSGWNDAQASSPAIADAGDLATDADNTPTPPPEMRWTRRLGHTFNAWVLGGLISGAVLGLILDLVWRWSLARAQRYRKLHPRPPHAKRPATPPSTDPTA